MGVSSIPTLLKFCLKSGLDIFLLFKKTEKEPKMKKTCSGKAVLLFKNGINKLSGCFKFLFEHSH